MRRVVKYDTTIAEDIREVYRLVNEGVQLLCPKCGAELIVALNMEAARQQKVHPGIFCPVDKNHVLELIELAEPRKATRELFAELRAEREQEQASKVSTGQ